MLELPDISWARVVTNLFQLAIAYVLALPIALNREAYSRSAGVRTFPLVAVATCGYMLLGVSVLSADEPQARVLHGIITGMGFIGGGAILKHKGKVAGVATAAALWSTGAIGVAVAMARYEIAIVLSVVNFLTLQFLAPPVKEMVQGRRQDIGNNSYDNGENDSGQAQPRRDRDKDA